MKNINIAIDGPAGAGKSTIAKAVAKSKGFIYIDTGAMYRSVALFSINNKINIKNNKNDLIFSLKNIKIEIVHTKEGQKIFLNGEDVSDRIRQEDVGMKASEVALIPEVRIMLVDMQREIASKNNVIMDGRDIGTYVLPNADLKIFLTASSHERATRRYNELLKKGISCDFEKIKNDIEMRDKNDSSREFAPLKCADDAMIVDTTNLELEQSIQKISELIEKFL